MQDADSVTTGELLERRAPRRRNWRRIALWSVIGLLFVLLLLYMTVGAVIATRLMAAERRPLTLDPSAQGLIFEEVSLTSRDGTEIAGWHIPSEGAARAVLMVHGKGSNRAIEWGEQFIEFARELNESEFAVMMIDLRGHGESGGQYFTLGDQERWDVSAAVDWLDSHGYEAIGILGVSLGGGSSAEASVINERVDALVLDSTFPDLRRLLEREFPKESNLPNQFLPGAILAGRFVVGGNIDAVEPAVHTGPDDTPLLVIYGSDDAYIPDEEFMLYQKHNPDAETWIVPSAIHARVYNHAPDEYRERVTSFFDQHLGR